MYWIRISSEAMQLRPRRHDVPRQNQLTKVTRAINHSRPMNPSRLRLGRSPAVRLQPLISPSRASPQGLLAATGADLIPAALSHSISTGKSRQMANFYHCLRPKICLFGQTAIVGTAIFRVGQLILLAARRQKSCVLS